MAPNRKGTFDNVDALATLNVSQFVETSKFQPLTALPSSATASASPSKEVTPKTVVVSSDPPPPQFRQDPSKQALIDRIVEEERCCWITSSDHIIQTEVDNGPAEEKTDLHREDTDSDDYWAMTTPDDLSHKLHSNKTTDSTTYWDWPTESTQQKKNDLIQGILEQERIRQLFSVDHVVLKIQEQAAALQQQQKTDEETLAQNDSYWNWKGDVELNDQDMQPEREEIIQHILEAEKLRQQFSVATLEERLTQEAKISEDVSRTVPVNDDYWAGF